jgi:hypothetical protein
MSKAIVQANSEISSWFAEPEHLNHYQNYAIWQEAIFFSSAELNHAGFIEAHPGKYEVFIEALRDEIVWVKGAASSPIGTLGLEENSGDSVESIQALVRSKRLELRERWRIQADVTQPRKFFFDNLRELFEHATAITYVDPYLGLHLDKTISRGSSHSFFIDELLKSGNRKGVTLRFATRNADHHRDPFDQRALQSFFNLKQKEFGIEASVTVLGGYEKHSRFLVIQFPGEVRAIWEPSFSVDAWSKPKFKLDHEVSFRRAVGPSEYQRLEAKASKLYKNY